MVAANINARTGEIIGDMAWSVAFFDHVAWVNRRYTGSLTGAYIGELDNIDAKAAENQGLTKEQFRMLPSSMRDAIRRGIRNYFYGGASPGNILLDAFTTNIKSSGFKSTMTGSWNDSSPMGLVDKFDADLVRGLIPELSDPNVTSDRKNAINYWWPRAATKMGWTKSSVAEVSKPIRRERNIKIETVLKGMYDKRVAGLSVTATVTQLVG